MREGPRRSRGVPPHGRLVRGLGRHRRRHDAANPSLALALRGSGQALYVGVAEDMFVVASEPYGVIEECTRYLRMDGETPGNPQNPAASRGQVVVLDRANAGELAGITRWPTTARRCRSRRRPVRAPVTTRDIDRGSSATSC
jgi:glucosamine--fructose-6-phosphate aminotransferase (isomerizing)